MRRFVLAASFLSLCFVAGLGCKHVAGKCDCSHHPDNDTPPVVSQPYPQNGGPISGAAVPEKLGAPEKK